MDKVSYHFWLIKNYFKRYKIFFFPNGSLFQITLILNIIKKKKVIIFFRKYNKFICTFEVFNGFNEFVTSKY